MARDIQLNAITVSIGVVFFSSRMYMDYVDVSCDGLMPPHTGPAFLLPLPSVKPTVISLQCRHLGHHRRSCL